MSNIYSMPLMIRRGETKVKNVGLQSFLGYTGVSRMYYGTGEDDFYPVDMFRSTLEFGFVIGGQSMELVPGSVNISPFLMQSDNLPSLRLISDVKSWQYAMLTLPSGINISTFCDRIGSFNKFEPEWLYDNSYRDYNGNKMSQYLYNIGNMSVYPYVYEWKMVDSEISEQKLTTWSEANPTSVLYNKRTGDETVKMTINGEISPISSSWSNKVKTAWTNYTRKLDGDYVYGLMAIARGVTSNTLTTRGFIRYFLQRCSNIDTTNDWTHIRLT